MQHEPLRTHSCAHTHTRTCTRIYASTHTQIGTRCKMAKCISLHTRTRTWKRTENNYTLQQSLAEKPIGGNKQALAFINDCRHWTSASINCIDESAFSVCSKNHIIDYNPAHVAYCTWGGNAMQVPPQCIVLTCWHNCTANNHAGSTKFVSTEERPSKVLLMAQCLY